MEERIETEKLRDEFVTTKDNKRKLELAFLLSEQEPETMRPVIQFLEPSAVDAPSIITLKLGSQEFNPLVAYPIFPADFIVGYENPKITLEIDETTLLPYVEVAYDGEPLPVATDIVGNLRKVYGSQPVYTDRKEWQQAVAQEKQRIVEQGEGATIGEFDTPKSGKVAAKLLNFANNSDYLQRVFIFCLFFIEGAVLPNSTDVNWDVIVLQKTDETKGFIGYCSMYRFWSYLSGADFDAKGPQWRFRIGQFLIMPPYQRQKMASEMYKVIMNKVTHDDSVTVLEIEDPNLEFDIMCDRLNYEYLTSNEKTRDQLEVYGDDTDKAVKELQKLSKLAPIAIQRAAEVYYYSQIQNRNSRVLKKIVKTRLYIHNFEDLEKLENSEMQQKLEDAYNSAMDIVEVILRERPLEAVLDPEDDEEDDVEDELEDQDELLASFAKRQRQS